jgi:hypothetical protein
MFLFCSKLKEKSKFVNFRKMHEHFPIFRLLRKQFLKNCENDFSQKRSFRFNLSPNMSLGITNPEKNQTKITR